MLQTSTIEINSDVVQLASPEVHNRTESNSFGFPFLKKESYYNLYHYNLFID